MTHYHKLVRDRIPETIRRAGGEPQIRRLLDGEFAAALGRKLMEEAQEFAARPTAEELADVLEVVHALTKATGILPRDVEDLRRAKAAERGAFDDRLLLESVSYPEGLAEASSPRTWPQDWEARRAGQGCPMCAEGPTDMNALGERRIFSSRLCDAYLRRTEVALGYTVVVWRGRHVAELTNLSDPEGAEFDRAVRTVARALERHYRPAKLNLLTLGNAVPHLHVHIVPRYVSDPDPGKPPRFMMVDRPSGEETSIPDDIYLSEVSALRRLVGDLQATPAELANVGRVTLGPRQPSSTGQAASP